MKEYINNPEGHKNIAYTLSLLSAVINGKSPVEPDFEPDWDFIFRFTKMHNVDNTVFYAVEQLKNKPEPQLYKKWMNIRNKCIHRNMIQRQEYAEICSAFEENSIDYMPVKGFYLSELYPIEDSRYMGDLDILVKDRRDDAVQLLTDRGYSTKKNSVDYDKPLIKPPFMVVELHNNLFPQHSPYRAYFDDVFSKSAQNGHCFKMNPEDFYIYELVHLYKHFSGGGAGIRSVADFYLINKKLLPDMDADKIKTQLEKLELNDFSDEIASLAKKWFKNEDFSDFTESEIYVINSGTYGTDENKIVNQIGDNTKSEYLKFRFLPPKELMYEIFPRLNKHPYLLPFYYILRFFRGFFKKRKNLKEEYKILKLKSAEKNRRE